MVFFLPGMMKCKQFSLSDLGVTGVPPRFPYHCSILPCCHHACKINWALAHGRVYTLVKNLLSAPDLWTCFAKS